MSHITTLDSYPGINGVVNPLLWTWIEEQSARDEHGILRIILKPCAGIRLTTTPSTEPFLIQEIEKQCRRSPRERAELLALGGHWAEGEETTPEETTPIVRDRYTRRTREMLAGKHQNEYNSRSEFEAAVIMGLVSKGATREECLAEFENNPVAERFRHKQDMGWFERAYKSAVRKVDAGDSRRTTEIRRQLAELYPVVATMSWARKDAITNRKTLLACFQIALKVGSTVFHAGHIEVSEIAVMPHQTVIDALARLCDTAYLTRISNGQQHRYSSTYRLNLGELKKTACSSHLLFGDSLESKSPRYALFLNELFSAKALPSSSQEIYEALRYSGSPMSAEALTCTGRRIETVRKALKAMLRYGLVTNRRRLYEIDEACDLEQLSRYINAAEFCQNESGTATVDSARQNLGEKHRALREKRFDKSGRLKTEALKVALESGDEEMQRFILCPTSGVIQ